MQTMVIRCALFIGPRNYIHVRPNLSILRETAGTGRSAHEALFGSDEKSAFDRVKHIHDEAYHHRGAAVLPNMS